VKPRHVAIIMDGNGRWAQKRFQPRPLGHRAGIKAVRLVVKAAASAGVEVLTLFAFSQENWNRPAEEVGLLMQLLIKTLADETEDMHQNGIRMRFIGDRRRFALPLQAQLARSERQTEANTGMVLMIALGYGGQQDILQAAQAVVAKGLELTEAHVEAHLQTAGFPDPDLLIRTGGESRISNFLLWQSAYAELYFSDVLWPDFAEKHLLEALAWYAGRQRRFGLVPDAAST
jgi:undecaprenyl diphosphate synthase